MCAPATATEIEPELKTEAAGRTTSSDTSADSAESPARVEHSLIVPRRERALPRDTTRTTKHVLAGLRKELGAKIKARVTEVGLNYPPARLALFALKEERKVEVWGAGRRGSFTRVHTYPIRGASGHAGPKTRQGDLQVPEGEYQLTLMNPASRFHLSMKVDYPSRADRRQAAKDARVGLGGDIYIHGSNVSIGCIAIGDRAIEELFLLVAESGHARTELVIAPRDLRVRRAPKDERPWVMARYERIALRMAELRSPAKKGLTRPKNARGAREVYTLTRTRISELRKELKKKYNSAGTPPARKRVLADARLLVLDGLTEALFPAWYGTDWSFNGISETPGEGSIACGVFVGTLLRDAGFNLSRFGMGRLASEHIAQRLTGEGNIRRYSNRPAEEVVRDVQRWGSGLYLVGLDIHVGFLIVNEHKDVRFVHSSYVGSVTVVSEAALGDNPFNDSKYRVVARLLDDTMMRKWLGRERFSSEKPRQ